MSPKSAIAIDSGLRRLLDTAELTFVPSAGLKPCPIPTELRELEGSLDGETLTLRTRRYSGPRFAAFTVATISTAQRLCSLTVVGLPPPGTHWPVLGIDIIALRDQISLLAMDLAPMDRGFWEVHCRKVLEDLAARTQVAIVPRKRPDFAADSFSQLALIAGVRAGEEAPVFAAAELFLHSAMRITDQESGAAESVAASQRRADWLAAERRNRKEHNALARMFGAAVSARYLDDFLFGIEMGAAP